MNIHHHLHFFSIGRRVIEEVSKTYSNYAGVLENYNREAMDLDRRYPKQLLLVK